MLRLSILSYAWVKFIILIIYFNKVLEPRIDPNKLKNCWLGSNHYRHIRFDSGSCSKIYGNDQSWFWFRVSNGTEPTWTVCTPSFNLPRHIMCREPHATWGVVPTSLKFTPTTQLPLIYNSTPTLNPQPSPLIPTKFNLLPTLTPDHYIYHPQY